MFLWFNVTVKNGKLSAIRCFSFDYNGSGLRKPSDAENRASCSRRWDRLGWTAVSSSFGVASWDKSYCCNGTKSGLLGHLYFLFWKPDPPPFENVSCHEKRVSFHWQLIYTKWFTVVFCDAKVAHWPPLHIPMSLRARVTAQKDLESTYVSTSSRARTTV